jgi:glutathione S-transferase
VRYLAAKYGAGTLEPADLGSRARASSWMDWQLTVAAPALTPVFWGLVRTPPEKRDHAAIETGMVKTIAAMKVLDAQLAKSAYVTGDALSMGDIPVALMAYRFCRLIPDRRHRATPRVQAARPGDTVRVGALPTTPRRVKASAPRRRGLRPRG